MEREKVKGFKKAVLDKTKGKTTLPKGPSKTALTEMVAKIKTRKEWKKNMSIPMDSAMREQWKALAVKHDMTHADVFRLALEYAYNSKEFHELLASV